MKILLDTHVIIWAITDDMRLSKEAKEQISSSDNIIFYSTASIWEIAIKNQKAASKCPYHEKEIENYCKQAGYYTIPIQTEHVLGIRNLRIKKGHYLSNSDPFDRIILSQAKVESCKLLTHDTLFNHYDEDCIYKV